MLKNVQDAKFNKALIPISRVVLEPAQRQNLAFDSFFTHILMHELMHGLGPHNITVAGAPTTVRLQLKDLYSAIEEAKADMTGLWALQYLIDKGVVDKQMERTLYTTYLASMFRSVRFRHYRSARPRRGHAVQLPDGRRRDQVQRGGRNVQRRSSES